MHLLSTVPSSWWRQRTFRFVSQPDWSACCKESKDPTSFCFIFWYPVTQSESEEVRCRGSGQLVPISGERISTAGGRPRFPGCSPPPPDCTRQKQKEIQMQIQQSPLQGIRLETCTSLTTGTLGAVRGGAKMTSKEPQEVTASVLRPNQGAGQSGPGAIAGKSRRSEVRVGDLQPTTKLFSVSPTEMTRDQDRLCVDDNNETSPPTPFFNEHEIHSKCVRNFKLQHWPQDSKSDPMDYNYRVIKRDCRMYIAIFLWLIMLYFGKDPKVKSPHTWHLKHQNRKITGFLLCDFIGPSLTDHNLQSLLIILYHGVLLVNIKVCRVEYDYIVNNARGT